MQLCFGHFVGGSHCSLWDVGLSSSFISTPLIAYLALALRADAVLHLQLKEGSLQEAVFHSQLPSGCRECASVWWYTGNDFGGKHSGVYSWTQFTFFHILFNHFSFLTPENNHPGSTLWTLQCVYVKKRKDQVVDDPNSHRKKNSALFAAKRSELKPLGRQEQEVGKQKVSLAILPGALLTFVLLENIMCIDSKRIQKHS